MATDGVRIAGSGEGVDGTVSREAAGPGSRVCREGSYPVATVTSVSVDLMPAIFRILWTTMSRAVLMCAAWIFTITSNGPVTACTSVTLGIARILFFFYDRGTTEFYTKR